MHIAFSRSSLSSILVDLLSFRGSLFSSNPAQIITYTYRNETKHMVGSSGGWLEYSQLKHRVKLALHAEMSAAALMNLLLIYNGHFYKGLMKHY